MFSLEDTDKLFDVSHLVCIDEYGDVAKLQRLSDTGDFYRLLYVKDGIFRFKLNGISVYMEKEDIFICPPFSRFCVSLGGITPSSCTVFDVSFVTGSSTMKEISSRKIRALPRISAMADELVKSDAASFLCKGVYGRDCLFCTDRIEPLVLADFKLQLERLLNTLTATCRKAAVSAPVMLGDIVSAAVRYMDANIEKNLTVAQIAKQFYVSESTLKNRFCRRMKVGVIEYFLSAKIKRSVELIKEHPEVSITEISEYLGFSSVSYFSRQFKKRVGVTPLKYKKENSCEDK